MQLLERLTPRLLSLSEDVGLCVHQAIESGAAVLLEGAQGSLLDIDHGTYPFVTSSNTTSGGAAIGAGIAPTAIDAVLGVVKAYTTRVGHGPLPTEIRGALGERVRELGNEFGAVTGRPRRCGWFDAVVVRYATRVNGLSGLAVTKLDVLDTLDRIAICTGYRVGDEVYQRVSRRRHRAGAHRADLRVVRWVAAADERSPDARGAAREGPSIPRPHSRAGRARRSCTSASGRGAIRSSASSSREWGIGNR